MSVLEVILIVLVVVLVIAIWSQWRSGIRIRRKLDEMSALLDSLDRERPALAKMVRHNENDETRDLIRHRYDLISELLAAAVSGDPARTDAVLEEVDRLVENPEEFMRQIRLIYTRMQPRMMDRLDAGGLTDREKEICCLYVLGLNGKTIQQYTRDGRHFQNVSVIRKKLGLGEHDRNIDGFLRSLLK
jgi:hypothetical protein